MLRRNLRLFVILHLSTFCIPSFGQGEGTQSFAGLKFGVGITLTNSSITQSKSRVESAEIIGNVVRITEERNSLARIMLESHYFFTPAPSSGSFLGVKNGNWGIGPFVAIQPGSENIIDAIGTGLMIGFKRAGDDTSSFNLGIGFVTDPSATVLGDGFEENKPPPEGESTTVRLRETSFTSLLFLASFSF